MSRRSNILAACFATLSLATLSGLGCGSNDGGTNASCTMFTSYTATTANPLTFTTDIYPIFADTNAPAGCAQALICHGQPMMALDPGNTKYLTFVFGTMAAPVLDPGMARAQLLMPSVNAPSMQRVTPGSVGQSFLAYKIAADRNGLACASSSCQSGASVGISKPCGDLMPSLGTDTFSAANRTKILDWIAQGASL